MSDHFLPQFKHHLLSLGRAERTLNAYESDLRHFAVWFEQFNKRPFTLKELTATDVREYRTALLRRKCAPATVNRALAALRTLGAWAVGTGALSVNPATNICSVETPALAPKGWTPCLAQPICPPTIVGLSVVDNILQSIYIKGGFGGASC
ncbi:MAG TPA: phage integrase N-terminal SAM-like domain-containing protein [Pyrinomonadaceae bacterium]|nr:phage integrase N-terminal SAM-like domain-containing protein [Pyrinomonadaceae bacterium]